MIRPGGVPACTAVRHTWLRPYITPGHLQPRATARKGGTVDCHLPLPVSASLITGW